MRSCAGAHRRPGSRCRRRRPRSRAGRPGGRSGRVHGPGRPSPRVPSRPADGLRAGAGHDALVRRGERALGEVHQVRARGPRLPHERPDDGAAVPQLRDVTGIGVQRHLRRRQDHGLPGSAARRVHQVAASGGVRLSRLGRAPADPPLQVAVTGHHMPPRCGAGLPAARPQRAGDDERPEYERPFAPAADRRWEPVLEVRREPRPGSS